MASGEHTRLRALPASGDAERAVLGVILLDNSAYYQASAILKPDDFSTDSHRRIFRRMMDLAEKSHSIDLVTLSNELMQHSELELIGGAAYVSSLTDGQPRLENIDHYIELIRDKALLRRLVYICDSVQNRCLDGTEEIDEILDFAENEVLEIGEKKIRKGFIHFRDIFRSSFESIDALHDRGKRITGLETGFRNFDDMTRGLQPGELIIIAARPSVGKTSFALNIAQNAAIHQQQPVGVFSLEMSKEALVLRLLCAEARVDSHRLQTGFASREDWAKMASALGRLAEAPLFIDDTAALSITEMRAKARRLQKEHGLGLVIVDYLQLMSGRGASTAKTSDAGVPLISQKFENRTQEVSAISRGLKGLAKELRIPVIAISQLNRAPEERGGKPRLSDLRESGQIEQDADLVAFLFREGMAKPNDPSLKGRAELIIEKQRNGPTGTVKLAFIPEYTCFENLAEDFVSESEE